MDGIIVISALAAVALLCAASKKRDPMIEGLEDDPVSIDNIRMGVQRGWYTCTLTRVDDIPAVRLSGRTADGKDYSDLFRISETDWQTLKNDGYRVE